MDRLVLHVPRREEFAFRQKLLSDPATMAYNAPWFPPDGCIPFSEKDWENWYPQWIGHEGERFFAYLQRESDGAFVGDVCYHRVGERDCWEIEVLIYAPERGKGYSEQGLALLLDHAFRVDGVKRLRNEFESSRLAARRAHRAVGFREISEANGMVAFELSREEYLAKAQTSK